MPVKIPSHPYILVNRSILYNCGIEADNHHLLESIASCDKKTTKLIMYFTINLAFTNYLDMLPNMTDLLSLIRDRTQYDNNNNNKEIFDLQQKHAMESHIFLSSKFFFQSDCKYFYIYFFYNLNNNNNISHLLILQT